MEVTVTVGYTSFPLVPASKQSAESVCQIPDAVCSLRLLMMDGKTVRNM